MRSDFFTLLQLNDATFPIGSYTLSWGLETFVQQGVIFGAESAKSYLESELLGTFVTSELLCTRLSYESAELGDFESLARINEIYNAGKTAKEIREGSKKLALRFLKTVFSWGEGEDSMAEFFSSGASWHFPPVYGSYCAFQKIDEGLCLRTFLYSQLSSRVVTLVKLVPLSQTDGQKILHDLFPLFDEIMENALALTEADLCRSSPASEIRAMQHEFLYTRLYSN